MNTLDRIFRTWARWQRRLDERRTEWRNYYFPIRAGLGSWGNGCRFGPGVTIEGCARNIHLGGRVTLGPGVRLVCTDEHSEIRLGDNTFVLAGTVIETGRGGRVILAGENSLNPYCVVYGHGGLDIGKNVRIASHTVIIPANHNFADPNVPIKQQGLSKEGIRIEDDVWIGTGCRILDGVVIGTGSVIGAGSVVTRSFPPGSVCVGVPARAIKNRFGEVP